MKTVNKKIAFLLLVVFSVFVLTGCVRMDVGVTIKANGKADVSFMYAVSDALAGYSENGLLDMDTFDDLKEEGFTLTPYAQDGYTGMVAKATDMDLSELSKGDSPLGELADEGLLTREGNKYIIDYNMWDSKDYAESAQYLGMVEQAGGYMTFTLTTPVKAVNHNATTVSEDGKTLTWNLLNMGGEPIHAEFEIGGGIAKTLVTILVAVAFLLGLVLVAINRRKKFIQQCEDDIQVTKKFRMGDPGPGFSNLAMNYGNIDPEPVKYDEVPTDNAAPDKPVAETPAMEAAPAEPVIEVPVMEYPNEPAAEVKTDEDAVIEQLKKYKQLMDDGVITPEDYEKKKQQLLGL